MNKARTKVHPSDTPTLRWRGPVPADSFWPMKAPGRIILRTAVIGVLAASSSWAQQSPGLSAKPSGRTLAEPTTPPAEQPVDLSRPEMQQIDASQSTGPDYAAAAARGETWAQVKLAKFYLASSDDEMRLPQAVHLLTQAAEQGEPEALFILGSLAMAGHGMPRSTEKAFDYCRRAAELDFPDAQYELATMYAMGRGTQIDNERALLWARKAMDQGNSKAKYSVGRMLLVREKAEDQKEAIELLNQAIASGIDEAGMFLAEAYTSGQYGLPKDDAKSVAILEKLAARGNTTAGDVMGRMRSSAE
jgi:TPR repeat protein